MKPKTKPLMSPSQEQQLILDTLQTHDVVRVQAVAGSGKSTTIFLLAQQNPAQKIVVLTYNRLLKEEMDRRVKQLQLTNVSVYTYHGFASALALKQSHYHDKNVINDDNKLNDWLASAKSSLAIMQASFDILVADEFQDCNELYWRFLKELLQSHKHAKFLVLGDFRQTIYQFKGSHDWWLNFLDQLIVNKKIAQCHLSTTYRLPQNIVHFLNTYCFSPESDVMVSEKQNDIPVHYWHLTDPFKNSELDKIVDFIVDKLNNKIYRPDDIFIICDALKGGVDQIPSQKLENRLASAGVPIYYPDDDQKALATKVIANKVVFCTPWTAKGRERKLVIYLSFGYFFNNEYKNQLQQTQISNPTYVALTRALEELVIVNASHHSKYRTSYRFLDYQKLINDPLVSFPTWSRTNLEDDLKRTVRPVDNNAIESLNLQGSRIGKFLPTNLEIKLNKLVGQIKHQQTKAKKLIPLPAYTKKQNELVQEISVINSILFTSLAVDKLLGYSHDDCSLTDHTLLQTYAYWVKEIRGSEYEQQLTRILEQQNDQCLDSQLEQDLKHATIIYGCSNKLLNAICQIHSFDWLNQFQDWELVHTRTQTTIQAAAKLSCQVIPDYHQAKLEVGLSLTKNEGMESTEFSRVFLDWFQAQFDTPLKIKRYSLSGIFDFVAQDLYFEFKFTDSLSIEHDLQVIFYLFLLNLYQIYLNNPIYDKTKVEDHPDHFEVCSQYHLFNIRSNEWWVFDNNPDIINQIMVLIVASKLKKDEEIPPDFIKENKIKY